MKSIFPKDSFQKIEEDICNSTGISTLVLMENAGRSCVDFITANYSADQISNLLILAGKGNNAGDGFVIARHLANMNYNVKLGLVFGRDSLTGIALENFNLLKNQERTFVHVFDCRDVTELEKNLSSETRIIIDCIFGIGFKGSPDEKIEGLLRKVNTLENVERIAIDIPSGLTSHKQNGVCFSADHTLTMGAMKLECLFYDGKKNSGEPHVMNIGISDDEFAVRNEECIFKTEISDIEKSILSRDVSSNKYTNGKLLLISGSPGLTGATYLSAQSAIRTGSGAVIAAVPNSVFEVIELKLTEVMKMPLQENSSGSISFKSYEQIRDKIDWADVVLVGPGLSKNEDTMELVRRMVIENNSCRFLIDADAIYAFKGFSGLLKGKDIILTPHFGEFTGVNEIEIDELMVDFVGEAKRFSERLGITLVLKNAPTLIADNGKVFINPTGRQNLATAGSGDVLSGMIGAIWAKSGKRLESAIAGTLLHGMAGDMMYEESGESSTIASDLIGKIPAAKVNAGLI
ncbi:MAG: NAD(P)H-hydrate dehydratase [Ignavibacteria bacterium]|nr:NAD(P)H-hydrate dehydratase [Ignavibacteria bacterium]